MKIHPAAEVAPGAELAADVEIGPWCFVGPRVKLGRSVRLHSHVVVEGDTELGEGCEVYPFAMLGAPPQHAAHRRQDPSRLVIGARNLIREQVTIHGGSVVGHGLTRIGDDCTFYVGAHVGHDCTVGNQVTFTNAAALGGHGEVADHVILGGLCAVQQRCRIGRHAMVGGMSGVNFDVVPFAEVWGNHARLHGLNLIGLRRRGFSRDVIAALRDLYRALFFCPSAAPFRERVEHAAATFASSPEAMEVIAFIRAEPTRHLLPAAKALQDAE